jgi:hypothetical protein
MPERAVHPLWRAGAGLLAGAAAYRNRRRADVRGQVALVTGGSRGLALHLAAGLARQGCRAAKAQLER